jgi:hypothetical protein
MLAVKSWEGPRLLPSEKWQRMVGQVADSCAAPHLEPMLAAQQVQKRRLRTRRLLRSRQPLQSCSGLRCCSEALKKNAIYSRGSIREKPVFRSLPQRSPLHCRVQVGRGAWGGEHGAKVGQSVF